MEGLCWCANLDWAEILGIILHVLSRYLGGVCRSWASLLNSKWIGMRASAVLSMVVAVAVCRLCSRSLDLKVWTRQGGLKAPLPEKVNIGLDP